MTTSTAPPNENARPEPGARKIKSTTNQSQCSNPLNYENRSNAAACFPNKEKLEDWHDDFKGIAVVEGLADGTKVWVGVRKRLTRDGREYLTSA